MSTSQKNVTPTWTELPEDGDTALSAEIFRCPPTGFKNVYVTSHAGTGCYTHYISKRTIPCSGKTCTHCRDGQSRRYYGWLAIWFEKTDRQVIFEYTAAAAREVKRIRDANDTLTGLKLSGRRQGNRPNGRLMLYFERQRATPTQLPDAIDVQSILNHMWETNQNVHRTNGRAQTKETSPNSHED